MKFLDLIAQYGDPQIRKEIDQAIKGVLDSGIFIGGKEVETFEKEIAEFCGVKFAVSVNSGTDALFLALKSLEIGKGDEVITSPFTFISTAEVIANTGAKPVFADINPDTFNIDPAKIREKITEKTKAIMPVHLFGQTAEMDEIIDIVKQHNLFAIEDAAQAIGAEYKGKKAGSFGNIGCFSFFPSKNLGAFGDGGMVVTNDGFLAEKIRLLRNHGSSKKEKYLNIVLGVNSRLDAFQAAILRIKMKYLKTWNQKRLDNALYYNKFLGEIPGIKIPKILNDCLHIFNQYTIRAEERDELLVHLSEYGVPAIIYYPLPLHLQTAFKYLEYHKGDFSESEKLSNEVLSLPIYPELAREEQDIIIKEIKDFYARKN